MGGHAPHVRPKVYVCVVNIPPDTKDWTWVLEEACPECGFDSRQPARDDLAPLAGRVGEAWLAAMGSVPSVMERPEPTIWSPLEYACHVRDVFALATYRVGLMTTVDDPLFDNWDQDETANQEAYASQDPSAVTDALVDRAREFGISLAGLSDGEWPRPGRRGDGAVFTVESFARYLLHDPIHHLTDVTRSRWAWSSAPR